MRIDWLATILWADPNTPTNILGIKVTIFGVVGRGKKISPYSRESLSSVGDFCRQQAGITCLTGDGLLIIHAIAAVRKRDFF